MHDFLINLLASLVAAPILVFLGIFFTKTGKLLVIKFLNFLVGGDLIAIFENADDLKSILAKDLKRSRHILFFAGRGSELTQTAFESLYNRPDGQKMNFKVLLPQTSGAIGHDWTQQRIDELNTFDPGSGNALKAQIEASVTFIKAKQSDGNILIKQYNVPHIGRIILTDRYAYFTPYESDNHGRKSTVYQYARGGTNYQNLERFFNQVWESAV